MIADLDETIRQLLVAEFPIRNGEIDIKFDQPKREWSARLTKPTINFYLYDLRENVQLRRHQWEKAGNGNPRALDVARLKRTPFRVDCFYMLTTWANEPEDEHRLLSNCLTALFRYPILPRERLQGDMAEQPYEIQAALARHDRLTNPAEVWGALDNEMRPSISYVITLAVDPWQEITTPFARSVSLQTGQSERPAMQRLDETGANPPVHIISGTVQQDSAPAMGIQVALKGTGYVATTDAQGRYRLGALGGGDYILVAWPATGKPVEKPLTVPAPDGNYDIEL